MRSYLLICFAILTGCEELSASWTEEGKRVESEQIEVHENLLRESKVAEGRKRLEILHTGIRRLGHWKSFAGHDPAIDELYLEFRNDLLAIPGHATYIAEEIERLIADPANTYTDVRQRRWFIEETLVHLPSPETIWVLGNYLTDERYAPVPGRDNSGGTVQNSFLATTALRRIGLQESERFIRTMGNRISTREDKESCLRWWEAVKSGERTFSFKGQAVSYRFNGDGTWVTLPLADTGRVRRDGEGVTTGRIEKRARPEPSEDSARIVGARHLGWVVVCLVVVTFTVWRFARRAR